MWVTDISGFSGVNGSVHKIRASDAVHLGAFPVGPAPVAVAYDGVGAIFVVNDAGNSVSKLRTSDGSCFFNPCTLAVGSFPSGIVFDGQYMWITNTGDGTLTRLEPSTGQTLGGGLFPVGSYPGNIEFDGQNIWVSTNHDMSVTKLSAGGGALLATIQLNAHPGPIVFDGVNVWVGTGTNIVKIRPSDNTIVATFDPGFVPLAFLFDGTNMWVSHDAAVSKLRVSDGTILGTSNSGAGPLAFDGVNMWVVSGDGVTKF